MTREEMRMCFQKRIDRNNRLFLKVNTCDLANKYLDKIDEDIALASEFGFVVKEDVENERYYVL